jgi:hypothetical protein
MADNARVPIVEILQCPGVRVGPSRCITTKVHVDNMGGHHSCRQPAKGKQKDLLQMDSIMAGRVVKEEASRDGQCFFHWLKLALKVKGIIEMA